MNDNDMKQLIAEFGFLAEEAHDVEQSVKDQITRAAGKDEVDTVAFGLETDDGQIVKVYVNAEHAEKFEKEMAEMLGEVDDIEEALNQISKDIEVVDVEWPEDDADGDDIEDVDPEATAEDDTDGSEVMNSKVYSKKNKEKEQANEDLRTDESLSYGEELTQSLLEGGQHSIANQLSTVNQHLVYQAILHLGMPELAMDRSPYRSAIIRGIKDTALEMAHTPSMRTTLKLFIKHQAEDERDGGRHHGRDEPLAKDEPKVKAPKLHDEPINHGKMHDKVQLHKPAAKEPKVNPHAALMKHEPAKPPKDIKEAAELQDDSTAVDDFWLAMDSIINMLDPSSTKAQAARVVHSPGYKALVSRSSTQVVGKLTSGIRAKLKLLKSTVEKATGAEVVSEAFTVVEVEELLKKMLKLADSKGLNADRVVGSQAFKRLVLSGKASVQSLSSSVKRALQGLKVELDKVVEAELSFDDDKPAPESSAAAPEDQAADKKEPPVEAPKAPTVPTTDATDSGVSFKAEGDSLTISYPQGKFELSGENLERAMKALTNKQTLSVQTVGGKFAVFSPRGSSAVIKLTGSETKINLAPPDISAFLDAAGQVAAGDEKANKEEAS